MSDLEEMQAELRVDDEDWFAKPDFLELTLVENNLGDLTLSRQVALTMTSI